MSAHPDENGTGGASETSDAAADAVSEQQYTEDNDPTVTRFDAGAGGVAESRDDTEFAIDEEAASVPPAQPDARSVAAQEADQGGSATGSTNAEGGPHQGTPEGEPESPEQRATAADERTDAAAPPEVEEPG